MKRLILTVMALMGAITLAPMARSEESGKPLSPEIYQQLLKQQTEILKQCEAFLDSLDKYAVENEDKETAQRVHDAIAYIKAAKVDDKMRLIIKYFSEDEWFSAAAESLNVDGTLGTFISMLSGDNAVDLHGVQVELEKVRDDMGKNSTQPWDDVPIFNKAIEAAGEILTEQTELKGELDKPAKPGEESRTPDGFKDKQTELKDKTAKVRAMLEGMGEQGAAAAKAMKDAEANMSDAAGAAGKMGGGNPQAKSDASGAMQRAMDDLNKALGEMGAGKDKAMEKVKNSPSLKTLAQNENTIADKLKDIYDRMVRALGADSPASKAVADAVMKSRSAAGKAGKAGQSGGQNGSGGASGDQQKAQEDVDKAIAELEDKMAELKKIEELTNVEKGLEAMLKDQKAINDTTVAMDAVRNAAEESRPGVAYVFEPMELRRIIGARNKQEDLAKRVQILQGILTEAKTVVFPRVLDDVRGDMTEVAGKLAVKDVGADTQYTEAHIMTQLVWLKQAVHADLQTLKEKEKRGGGGGGSGNQNNQNRKKPPLPTLAEIKMLRLMQSDVHLKTVELAKFHDGRIAAIDADTRLTPEQKAAGKKTADEQTRMIGLRLASEQSKIEVMVRDIIENAQKSN